MFRSAELVMIYDGIGRMVRNMRSDNSPFELLLTATAAADPAESVSLGVSDTPAFESL